MDTDDMWNDIFGGNFESMTKRMKKMFSDLEKLQGADVRTYGYTIHQNPNGSRRLKEFGNSADNHTQCDTAEGQLAEASLEDGVVRAVFEIPGVSKEDIVLEGTNSTLSVSVETDRKKFARTLALPCDVNPDSAKAEYNNGILEVTLTPTVAPDPKTRISVG